MSTPLIKKKLIKAMIKLTIPWDEYKEANSNENQI